MNKEDLTKRIEDEITKEELKRRIVLLLLNYNLAINQLGIVDSKQLDEISTMTTDMILEVTEKYYTERKEK